MANNDKLTTSVQTAVPADAKSINIFALPDSYFADPTPWFKKLRDEDPIHQNADGSLLLTRYGDVKALWRDLTGLVDKREQFERRFGNGPVFQHHTSGMLFRDPPAHDRLRHIVNPFFTQSSIERLSAYIDTRVDELLANATEMRELDFVKDFAFGLPISVICRILGVPNEDGYYLHTLGAKILFVLNPHVSQDDIDAGHAATTQFMDYLRPFIHLARARPDLDPTDNIISAMVYAEKQGDEISEDEILHMCILMLNGGHETTTNLMGVGLNGLLDHPDQISRWRDQPELLPFAIEELIRFVSPLQLQGRRTTREVKVPSGVIPADTEVVISPAAANRDERVFDNPDGLDIGRKPNAHLAFGAGIHVCIGRPLARLEASIALPKILKHFSRIERSGTPEFNRNARFRGLARLPVRLEP
ncbi:cytochrome [Rhizorhabdus dicambivorans]|uniref:DsmA n=1 Tax=Rhizorhabdus dicambivorans TaxID=1850238 RepID=A0A2H4ZC42_9SPHN|nr:cytochrome [Rhizorhabdus dicambivorans]AUF73401.1 DsmA [Rhizorhabdus dicambivorans]AUF73408.1 DsmA [Rhizorhabdus dicambivorans]